MSRMTQWLALAALSLSPALARCDDPKPTEPTLVVQIKSISGLFGDVKYLAKLANQSDQIDQLDGVIAAFAGDAGLSGLGLDVKRPTLIYAFATPGGNDSRFAILIPVSNEESFVTLLDKLGRKAVKGGDDIYTVEVTNLPVPVYFKFANKYAYLTFNDKSNLDPKNIIAPEKISAVDSNVVLGLTMRLDLIPDELKQLILGRIELRLADIKDREFPGETPERARMRRQGIDAMSHGLKTVLSEGRAFDLQFSIDREKDDLGFSVAIDGKPDSLMSTIIGALGGGGTKFAPANDAALHVGLNLAVPKLYRPLLNLIDTGFKDLQARQPDQATRNNAGKIFEAVAPTLKGGELDLHLAASGPNSQGLFNVLAGIRVQDGQKIETAVKDVIGKMSAGDRAKVSLDAAKAGNVNVHKIEIAPQSMDAQAKKMFGSANLWAGFLPEAMVVGVGVEAAECFCSLKPLPVAKPSPVLVVEGSIARLATLDKNHPEAAKVAKKVFGEAPQSNDRLRLSLEGGAKLKLSGSIKGLAVKFFAQLRDPDNGI